MTNIVQDTLKLFLVGKVAVYVNYLAIFNNHILYRLISIFKLFVIITKGFAIIKILCLVNLQDVSENYAGCAEFVLG